MTKGIIYCVSNPSFRANIYKIGFTTMNLHKRMRSLYKTGVPTKFVINFAKVVKKCRETEREIHLKLTKLRMNPSREFFECPLGNIKKIFDKLEGNWWTDSERKEKKPKKKEKVTIIHKRRRLFRKVKHCILNYRA